LEIEEMPENYEESSTPIDKGVKTPIKGKKKESA
jgi:hypothetical protein